MKAMIFWLAFFLAFIREIWRNGADQGAYRARKQLRQKESKAA